MKPRHRLSCWAVLSALLAFQPAVAAEFYVHPESDDAHPETLAQPFASVTRAQEAVAPVKRTAGEPSAKRRDRAVRASIDGAKLS